MIIAHRAGLRIVEVPVEMRERQGGRSSITPLRSAYYMVKVLMAVAMQMLRRPVKLPEGLDPRHPRLADRRDRAPADRARARAPPAPAGALLSALAGDRRDPCSSSRPGPPCSRASPVALGIASPPNALFVVALGFFLAVLLHYSLVISRLSEQTSRLAQRLALLEERVGPLSAGSRGE